MTEENKQFAEPTQGSNQEQHGDLNQLEREILDFESRLWKKTAIKERAISAGLGITPVQYYQYLAALMDRPEAAQYAPATVRRLTEAVATRTSQRLI